MKTTSLGFCFATIGIGSLLSVGAGCGGSGTKTVEPTISIISPTNNAPVTLGTDAKLGLAITFTTTNFLLKPAGAAGCGVGCGHVDVLIDGAGCNTGGTAQNNQGAASPVSAFFISCATPSGDHMVTLELHNDDNSPLQDADGKTIAASVSVKATTGNSGVPSIAITSPSDNASVALGVDVNKSVAIEFTTQNFTLAAAGTSACGSGCGHVNITIDGTACNATTSDYNASGSASPISALFGLCPNPVGTHTVAISLQNDDNSAVDNAVAATVTFTTH